MRRASFVAPAREEFLAEVDFYANLQAGLGRRSADAVEAALSRALVYPLAGSPVAAGMRRVVVKDFPFSIIYRAEPAGVLVFAVAHHSRLPGYWRDRVV